MKLELKNIKFSEAMSEETYAFTADLFVNGKKIAYCKNNGHGGCTSYNPYDADTRVILKQADAYAESLPEVKYDEFGGGSFAASLENTIDHMFSAWLEEKDKKKNIARLRKDMAKGLVYGTPESYRVTSWGKTHTIETLMKFPQGVEVLKKRIKELKEQNETILNTNLGELID
jgi:hypothetical protein